jgi:hypothetical protein
MKEMDLIINLHKNSERQGPGSINDTLKALEFLKLPTHRKLKAADIGFKAITNQWKQDLRLF